MSEITTIVDLFNAYDFISRLTNTLFLVQTGKKFGVFSEKTMALVFPAHTTR